ncbi:nucleoside deaminase [Desulfosarcina alkanivorans]|nr:nucleoside deaminase [Desulfosarcina alkanivorans]
MSPETASQKDIRFMTAALDMARTALAGGEFPVGCVIADGRNVVARGHRTGTAVGPGNEIDHAEINALRRLCEDGAGGDRAALTLYCTMEPCLMCFSATVLSGIGRIVYAYEDVMGGGTGVDRSGLPSLYREARLKVIAGVLRKESLVLFQRFFADPGRSYWADSLLSRYTLAQPGCS